MSGAAGPQVLVLAGARATGDPLCVAEGVASKAVIDIAGLPMLARVLAALRASPAAAEPWVIGMEAAGLAEAAGGIACRRVLAKGAGGPATGVLAALAEGVALPLLITTCDHPLLTPAMIESFLAQSRASGADLTVGLAERAVIEAAYPTTRRTYLRFGRAELSGCNLFYLASEKAIPVLRFWQEAEKDRKHPWRIAWRFGALTALRILLLRPAPEAAFALLSRRLGARIRPVLLPFAEAAIDVDSPADLALVRDIFARSSPGAPHER